MKQKLCQAKTKQGRQCRALVSSEHQYCLFHRDPSRAAELGRKGGLRNRRHMAQAEEPGKVPETARDLKILLADAIAQLRAGRLDPKIATSIAYVAGPLLKTIELADLESRVVRLEEKLPHELEEEN
jgi:general stress protein YciG